jgi:chemotaxis protein MotB
VASKSNQPIIVIKKKRGAAAAAHHGGGWKVAYADFVTAMMAFFLLLWLLNVTTNEQKEGIAEFFDPAAVSRAASGSGGVLGGQSIIAPGARVSTASTMGMTAQIQREQTETEEDEEEQEANLRRQLANGKISAAAMNKAIADREDKQFKEAEAAIKQAIESVPELKQLAQNLLVDQTEEGLRIQIVDQDKASMFPTGSSQMYDNTRKLLGLVAQAVKKMPNKISIRGHTDSIPYRNDAVYNNWELSADRANASRRALIWGGIAESRIANVVGKADREHLFPQKPQAPENRRISVILLRDKQPATSMRADAPGSTRPVAN